jgi:mannose-6-phosphate isomerase-like protein (cupin superfamily)
MKAALVFGTLILSAAVLGAAAETALVTYVDHDKAMKGGSLVTAPDYSVSVNTRNMAGQVEVHENETDILYVMEGEATFVTGGMMIGGKQTRPNQWLGTDIRGGEAHQLTKGDVIVIPAGTPHWFKQVPTSIKYFTVKSIKYQ